MDVGKEEFLKEFGQDYGYPNGPKTIDKVRATEFKRLQGQLFTSIWFYTKIRSVQIQFAFFFLNFFVWICFGFDQGMGIISVKYHYLN